MGIGGFGRSSEPGLLVLVSLLDGPKHGYGISKDVERLTGRRLGPGTLYGAIARLEDAGLIAALPEEARRKPYALTAAGLAEARQEISGMTALAEEGRRRIGAIPA
jgi:DNA-binding PadR family transcriptional regulator